MRASHLPCNAPFMLDNTYTTVVCCFGLFEVSECCCRSGWCVSSACFVFAVCCCIHGGHCTSISTDGYGLQCCVCFRRSWYPASSVAHQILPSIVPSHIGGQTVDSWACWVVHCLNVLAPKSSHNLTWQMRLAAFINLNASHYANNIYIFCNHGKHTSVGQVHGGLRMGC